MGIARRLDPVSSGSVSIWDDLRIIRSRGGFRRVESADLGGTAAALQAHRRADVGFDEARRQLGQFLASTLEGLIRASAGGDGGQVSGQVLAAQSLNRIMLSGETVERALIDIRNDVGSLVHRDHEYVRKQEDILLRQIAQSFFDAVRSGRLDPPHVDGSGDPRVAASLGSLRIATTAVLACYEDDSISVARNADAPPGFIKAVGVLDARIKDLVLAWYASDGLTNEEYLAIDHFLVRVLDLYRRSGSDYVGVEKSPWRRAEAGRFYDNPDLYELDMNCLWQEMRRWRRGLITYHECEISWIQFIVENMLPTPGAPFRR